MSKLSEEEVRELSEARLTLRLAVLQRRKTTEAEQALSTFSKLSQKANEESLLSEYQRWDTHLSVLS